ncbi:MAG TPA: peptidyl-prolyl cis-trans isomerase [Methylomirabilota bacterium]|jgi:peptidyl-prolyl cis-trans isomerase D
MISFMRRYRKGLQVGLLVVIVAFVASLFVFGSRSFDGGGGEGGDRVATVNGERISRKQYQDRYQAVLDYYSQINRGRLSAEMAEQLGVPQRVVDELVTEAVVVQRAEAEGLGLDDEEFNAAVHAMREFQDNGRFSIDRYRRFLAIRGTDAERDLRRYLTMRKVQRVIVGGVRATDAEVEQAWQLRQEQVRAAWALVELAPLMTTVTATDDEIAEYLKSHPDEFKQPERRKVQYVTLVAKDFAPKVGDAEVEKYYTEHGKEFETPRQVKASHVLARVDAEKGGGSETEDKARDKIVEVIRRAKAGEDFAKLAREVSEDPGSKDKGGDLGWVSQGDMVPPFEQALFALKKGEISPEPVRTPFGFHVIKVVDVKEGAKKPLKEVAAQIRDRLAADAAEKAARAKADEVRPSLVSAKDFMAQARSLGLSPIETTMAKTPKPPGFTGESLDEAAFGLAVGGVTAPVKTPAGWVVLKVTDSLPAGVPPLADIRERVAASVKRQKADGVAAGKAKQVAEEARTNKLDAVAKKVGASYGETQRFSRGKPAERLPGDAQMAALQTPVNETSPAVRTPQGYYVVKVLERAAAGPVDPLEKDKLEKELTTQKQSQMWERWVMAARGDARIDVVGQKPARRS